MAIVVDSAASLPQDLARDRQLYVVPMRLNFGGNSYVDGRDLSPTDFYRMLRSSPTPATTSAPSPTSFLETFREAAAETDSVLCLTVASRFSSSFESARTAAREAEQVVPEVPISVIDTQSAAGGEGLIAVGAWRAAREGGKLEEVVSVARELMQRVTLLAFPDTLYYLWKGGRVPKIAHSATSLLRIKPVFELAQGEVRTVARPRTHQRAMRRLLELMRERAPSGSIHASIMHADASEAAEELGQRVEAEFPCEELYVGEFTPVMGAHIGPGLLGIAFWSR